MGYTQAGLNVSGQFGMPLYGVSGIMPFTGNQFWVDETNGSDKAFLKIADKLREDYRRGLLELEQEKSEDWNDD